MKTPADGAAAEHIDARDAHLPNDDESLTGWAFVKNLARHPIVIICCLYANLGAAMYGFDNLALSLCLSMPSFIEVFGVEQGGSLVLPTYWQSLWNAMPQITTALGGYLAGPIADRFGRRAAFVMTSLFSFAGVAVVYTAETRGQFLGGKMLNAVGVGMGLTAGQTYVSEIAPTNFRGTALSAYTISMNLGYMIAASIALPRSEMTTPDAFRLMFALEWIWPGLIILGAYFVPESPYYLAKRGDMAAATASLRKLRPVSEDVDPIARAIKQTVDHEAYIRDEGSFAQCFKGINWRRTRIVLIANGLNQMIGLTFMNNSPYFMIVAGMSPKNVSMLVEVGIAMAIGSSLFTFWALTRFGRRSIILGSLVFSLALFTTMGIAASVPTHSSASLWVVAITLQMVWLTVGPTIGPAMAVAGEVSAVKLRAQTMAIGFCFNNLYSTLWNVVVPYMFNTEYGNLGGKTGWVFFGTSIIALVLVWFEFPETKGLTFAQIDERFEARIKARKFAAWEDGEMDHLGDVKVDPVEAEHVENKTT